MIARSTRLKRIANLEDLAEDGQIEPLGSKRKRFAEHGIPESSDKKREGGDDGSYLPIQEMVPPAPRCGPWGGSGPHVRKLLLASSEYLSFCHNNDLPFVNDLAACAGLVHQIKGGTRLMPEVSELAFPDRLLLAKTAIKTTDAEVEKAKEEPLGKFKELAAERSRFSRERKQAIENADGLEDELDTAQTTIARLEREKVEGAERTKREMDHFRQSRHRVLMSERGRLFVSAARRIDKFRKYKADRDKLEDKRLLHSKASGTLQSMDRLEKWGIPVPKKLKDILSANEFPRLSDLRSPLEPAPGVQTERIPVEEQTTATATSKASESIIQDRSPERD
ncbi:hypothetical protein F2Q69_00028814 [Brassica cretica]|uniref:Uncharacterized protein n=1 Tax=Brassica cretica TaxID=69181 RepID=A0A8S9RX74_BRACR|nr:hypothetical protein F2Q69_00028814 [Brassica cretica]